AYLENEVFKLELADSPQRRKGPAELPLRLLPGRADGDGRRELFAVRLVKHTDSPLRRKRLLFIEALSGNDGPPLWRSVQNLGKDEYEALGTPCLWEPGPDGRPKLVVPCLGAKPMTYVFETGGGRLVHLLPKCAEPLATDLDGDGVPELCSFERSTARY